MPFSVIFLKFSSLLFLCIGTSDIVHAPPTSDHGSFKSCELDMILCDTGVLKSERQPLEAIKALFFNAYSRLLRILGNCFSTIKEVALDAARMQQVAANEEEVMKMNNLRSLFQCIEVDKKWDDLHFLDVAICQLPPATKDVAQLVMGHYRCHLDAYTKAISITEGKKVFAILPRKRGRQEKMVISKITVSMDIINYTCKDCLNLWDYFLVERLKIPRNRIQFCDARPGNSTTLFFKMPESFALGIEEKLSNPDVVWVIKDLGILRVQVPELFNVDLREVLQNVPVVSIRVGLESGVDFMSMTKVCVCACACTRMSLCGGRCVRLLIVLQRPPGRGVIITFTPPVTRQPLTHNYRCCTNE